MSAGVPASAAAALSPASATAEATAATSKKIPLEGPPEEYLPVPIPNEYPGAGAFAGGGLGGGQAYFPGGGFGGGPGGFGPGTYGYNGPLYFNSARRTSSWPAGYGAGAVAAALLSLPAMYMCS
ncbi:hypothetical protein ABZP36_012458 [Zizania latifolia]